MWNWYVKCVVYSDDKAFLGISENKCKNTKDEIFTDFIPYYILKIFFINPIELIQLLFVLQTKN